MRRWDRNKRPVWQIRRPCDARARSRAADRHGEIVHRKKRLDRLARASRVRPSVATRVKADSSNDCRVWVASSPRPRGYLIAAPLHLVDVQFSTYGCSDCCRLTRAKLDSPPLDVKPRGAARHGCTRRGAQRRAVRRARGRSSRRGGGHMRHTRVTQ